MAAATVLVEFRRLEPTGFSPGIAPVVDVELDPEPSFDVDGMYLDPRFRRLRFAGRTDNNYFGDSKTELELEPNDEVAADTWYVVTVRFGSKKRRFRIKVPTAAQAADAELTAPYTLKQLVDYTATLPT